MQCILVRISSYAPAPAGASTASSRVWHRRHPATVEFGSIPQNRNVCPIIYQQRTAWVPTTSKMESSSGLRSRSHARLANWND